MLPLSAIAYGTPPEGCVGKFENLGLKLLKTVEADCKVGPFGSVCSGYIGLIHAKKAIVLAFRGTTNIWQLLEELKAAFEKVEFLDEDHGEVHPLFLKGVENVFINSELQPLLALLLEKYPDYEIYITGHSLGGALAGLTATWLSNIMPGIKDRIVLYTFGQPRIGTLQFVKYLASMNFTYYRVSNGDDIVTCVATTLLGYHHAGTEVLYTNDKHEEYYGDKGCSMKTRTNLMPHTHYFGRRVGEFCSSG
ncbi:unnamed protein product [Bursaphelenchus xylophilus]|uniref:(pine wood nematode) hypothetical protein n=1 Tax=Bursaphelenchus xylophilus TaxID=6326 RepID=A0A1I7SDM4_BURXY|nr:unnamed protein product [Bursaphelenchus xylophilus]CAG9120874.1 unnamed protein product [Bursaphelenchus xylophilus]